MAEIERTRIPGGVLETPEQLGIQAMPPNYNPEKSQLIPLAIFESFVPEIWKTQVMRNSQYIEHPDLGPSLMYGGASVGHMGGRPAPNPDIDERLTPISAPSTSPVPSTSLGSGSNEAGLGGLLPFRSAVRGAVRSM